MNPPGARGRDIWTVAAFEWRDALHSRRALAVGLLFLILGLGASWGFLRTLNRIEGQLVESLGLGSGSETTGNTTAILWESEVFRQIMTRLVGDRALAQRLLSVPPLGLFFAWLALSGTPLLVMLTATPRIAEDLQQGAARYVLLRTTRTAWIIGKFAGQAVLLAGALALGALATGAVGALMLTSFEFAPHAAALAQYAFRAWLYALPFLALALVCSQVLPGPHLATAVGLASLIATRILHALAQRYTAAGGGRVWDLVDLALPYAQRGYLWWNDPARLIPAALTLGVLSAAYLAGGLLLFERRSL
ncbi:MAG: hypothetical protein K9N49_10640 [Candidatus Marinimicrobia bacterium]|nr:hypothetical protein [Candidatus Neomarinimicrobiota bacterium]